jgi:hypothetical protein
MTRRKFLQIAPAIASTPLLLGAEGNKFAPIRQITRGPDFHWFAYYNKLHFSPDNRFVSAIGPRLRTGLRNAWMSSRSA